MSNKEFNEALEKTEKALKEGNEQEAFSAIRPIFAYPGMVATEDSLVKALEVFTPLAKSIGGEDLQNLVALVASKPDDENLLFDLSYALYDQGLFPFSATLLSRANAVAPSSPKILAELATTFEMMMLYHQARTVLEASPDALKNSAFLRYLHGFHTLMSGDVESAREILDEVLQTDEDDVLSAAGQLEGMVIRAEELKKKGHLGEQDLRGWHLALNGSLLLQLSPFGFDDGMNGRYAFLNDSYGLCHEGCMRLKQFLDEAKFDVERVYYIAERSSEILARAMAKILDKPLVEWGDGKEKPGLIVVYDLAFTPTHELFESLQMQRPGQLLWAHASCWTNPFPYSPDITTFLYQSNTAPWTGGGMIYNTKTQEMSESEADESPAEELAEKILAGEFETPEDGEAPARLLQELKKVPKNAYPGVLRSSGFRARQRAGSPVPSARFV